MRRLYDRWGRYGDSASEFYTTFRYSLLAGLGPEPGVTRRDPSAVVHAHGCFHVWYTRRAGGEPDSGNRPRPGREQRWDVAAYDWDLAEIWHATSSDGITWNEQGRAVAAGPRGAFDGRSVFTPGILVWRGRYYLYYQAVGYPYGTRTRNTVGMAWAETPAGPWHRHGEPVLTPGTPGAWLGDDDSNAVIRYGAWDSHKVHDPQPLVRGGQVWLYYKGQPMGWGTGGDAGIGWGVATADRPEGPFVKSPLNPVTNSGHETLLFPYREGVAAICNHDGPGEGYRAIRARRPQLRGQGARGVAAARRRAVRARPVHGQRQRARHHLGPGAPGARGTEAGHLLPDPFRLQSVA